MEGVRPLVFVRSVVTEGLDDVVVVVPDLKSDFFRAAFLGTGLRERVEANPSDDQQCGGRRGRDQGHEKNGERYVFAHGIAPFRDSSSLSQNGRKSREKTRMSRMPSGLILSPENPSTAGLDECSCR